MVFTIHTHRTALYTLLITMALALLPVTGEAAPQQTDITKPTRERVNKNKAADKKDDKKADKKAEKKAEKKDDKKPEAKPVTPKKEEPKPAVATKKEEPKPAAATKKEEPAKQSTNDTTTKKVEPAKSKVPSTVNPDNVQFDGIDISKHQGTINWEELKKNQKIKFIYIKATEGSDFVDPSYRDNIRNARKHGFKVGSYHFLSTRSAATTQFYNFIRTAKREDQDLLPIIDVEKISPWSPQQLRDSVKVFADLIEDYYGCKPLIYTSEKFFTSNLGRAFANYPLFIAKYSDNQPNIGYKWILWQFTDRGLFKPVKGNNGKVDMSRFAKGYSINDILYVPSKHKPKTISVKDAVDHKEKPEKVNMTEQKPKETPKAKEAPKPSKRQQEEAKKQAEKEKKAKERNKKLAEEEAKKKAEAQKKEQQKAEQLKREKAKQQAREAAAKKENEEKAKRKAEAQKARQQKAQRDAQNKTNKSNKSANLINSSSSSKLTQSQHNDSIRNAKYKGRKTNKSSADND